MSARSRLHARLRSTTFLSIGLIALAATSSPAMAQTNWTGATSSDWFDASNWNPATVPSAGTVVLDTATPNPTVVVGAAATAGTVIVGDAATGQLTLDAGGTMTAGSAIIANQAGSTGTLNIGAGGLPGTLNAATVTFGAGTGSINFNHVDPAGHVFTSQVSGNGTVNVVGTSFFSAPITTFTGNNTYTGTTTISGAQLHLGDGGTSGSITGNVVLVTSSLFASGSLAFNRSDTLTMGGNISGFGLVAQVGTGTTVLTGNNTYTGNTNIFGGTLIAGSDTALGQSVVQISDGATLGYTDGVTIANTVALVFGAAALNVDSGTATQAGEISAPVGTFSKTGAGTLVLTADSINVFGTTISGGRLQLGNGGTTGSIAGDIVNDAVLAFNRSDTMTFAGVISGTGVVEQNGTGTTELTGANTYLGGTVINAGTLSVATDGNLGDLSGTITFNGGTLRNTGVITTTRNVTLNAGGGTFQTDADLEVDGDVSGSGGLTKTGAATLILTGFNTFDGPTTIAAGTLLAASSTALSPVSAITVNAGAALQIADSGILAGAGSLAGDGLVVIGTGSLLVVGLNDQSTTFSGSIVGGGTFEKEGAGTLTLTGTSSIGGELVVCCGTLDISGGSFTAGLTDVAFGTLAITNGGRLQTGDLLNSANLLITGAGSIATASGDTVIGAFGTATATVSNGGKLESLGDAFIGMDSSITVTGTGSTWTIAGALGIGDPIGGPGTLTIADGAVVTVTGFAVIDPTGTLNLGNGGLAGTIVAPQIINDGQIVANFTDTLSLAVPIDGVGSLTKTGTGTLILTGTSTYTGATTVNAGRLIVNGAIASAVAVNSGGLLGGNGTVGGFTADAGGTVSPGNSVGTLHVAGDVAFAAGSTYLVEIDATNNADRIVATGTATLGGGTVQVTKAGGGYTAGTRYTILTANTGVNGTFAGLAAAGTSLPLLDLALTYDPNNVYLDVTRNAVTFCGIAGTRNQCAVGSGAESLGAGNTVFDAIVSLTDTAGIRRAFDLLSGEIHASTASTMVEQSQYLRDAVISRVRQSYGATGPAAALTPEGKVMAFAGTPPGVVPDATPADAAARLFAQAPAAPAAGDAVIAAWTQGIRAWGKRSGDGNAGTLSRSLGGFLIGVDATVDRTWRIGLAAGYTRASFDVDSRASLGNSDNYHVALYGGGQFGALGLRAGASFTWHDIGTTRRVAFPGVVDRLKADYNARTTQVFGEASYAIALARVAFEPFAGLAYVNYRSDRINESGGAAALTGRRQAFDMGFSTLGLRAAATVTVPSDTTVVTLRGTLGWRHAFGDVTPEQRLAFRAGGSPFTVVGVPIARDSLIVEAGVDIDVTHYAKFGLTYSGQFASSAQDHAIKGSLTLRF